MAKKVPKATAFVTISPVGLIGTANNFRYGEYFSITGTRGNEWLFSIDRVMKLARTSKDAKVMKWYKFLDKLLKSEAGFCIGAPLADIVNALAGAKDVGDDAVVKLHEGSNDPDDRVGK